MCPLFPEIGLTVADDEPALAFRAGVHDIEALP